MTTDGRPENDLKEKSALDPGRESTHIFYSREMGAPESSAPLFVAGHAAGTSGGHEHACDRHPYRRGRRPRRAAHGAPGDGGVPGRAPPRRDRPADRLCRHPVPRASAFGICRRKCRQARRVGRDRHSRSAFEGRECRVGSDLSTRCLCRRRGRASGLAGRHAPCRQIEPDSSGLEPGRQAWKPRQTRFRRPRYRRCGGARRGRRAS